MKIEITSSIFYELLINKSININYDYNFEEYGMRYIGCRLADPADYLKGLVNFCEVFDKELFLITVLKYNFEYKVIN